MALRARIAKDTALACGGGERLDGARFAAQLYSAIFARTGGYYPAINAATLWLISGDRGRARGLAETVLDILARSRERSYWAAATEAEAQPPEWRSTVGVASAPSVRRACMSGTTPRSPAPGVSYG